MIVTVAVDIKHDDTSLVQVLRGESVIPVDADQELDLVDLTRAVLGRLIAEASEKADSQITELRALLMKMAP